jgi:hypothetical protein
VRYKYALRLNQKFAFALHVTDLGHARLLHALLQLADNLVSRYTTSDAKHQRSRSTLVATGAYQPSGLLHKLASTEIGCTTRHCGSDTIGYGSRARFHLSRSPGHAGGSCNMISLLESQAMHAMMRSHKGLSPKGFSVLHETASLTKLFRVAHHISADDGPTWHDKYFNTPRGCLFCPYTLRFAQGRICYQISGKAKYADYGSRPPKDVCCWA